MYGKIFRNYLKIIWNFFHFLSPHRKVRGGFQQSWQLFRTSGLKNENSSTILNHDDGSSLWSWVKLRSTSKTKVWTDESPRPKTIFERGSIKMFGFMSQISFVRFLVPQKIRDYFFRWLYWTLPVNFCTLVLLWWVKVMKVSSLVIVLEIGYTFFCHNKRLNNS